MVQLFLRVEKFLYFLGYCSGKGSLKEQRYKYVDGCEQNFAEILMELGWSHKEYLKKAKLFHWAENIVANKTWQNRTRHHPSRSGYYANLIVSSANVY